MHFSIRISRAAANDILAGAGKTASEWVGGEYRDVPLGWAEEHDRYYGTSAGYQEVTAATVAAMPDPAAVLGWDRDGGRVTSVGYRATADGVSHQWVACSGNRWRIDFAPDGATAIARYWGRRHGQTRVPLGTVKAATLIAYETTEPSWPAWWTRDDAVEAGVAAASTVHARY